MLKPVGSFPGQGKENEELIFDLGGNVAEWAVTPTVKAKRWVAALTSQPIHVASHEPAAAYIGLRVVRGDAKPK